MIPSQSTKIIYLGDGTTMSFPFNFKYSAGDDVKVAIYEVATDTTTVLERDYFVDTNANIVKYPGYPPGEEPALSDQPEPLPSGYKLVIYRETPITQEVDLGSKYPLSTLEKMDDKAILICQELAEKLSRTLVVEQGSELTPQELAAELKKNTALAVNSAAAAAISENNASNSVTAAAASQIAAAVSATNAAASENTAAESEDRAVRAAQTATIAEANALAYKNMAAQYEANALSYKDSAAAYEATTVANATSATASANAASASQTAAAASAAEAASYAHSIDFKFYLRQPSIAYAVDDIAYTPLLKSYQRLECVVGGTTSSGDLDVTSSTTGQYIQDGTVKWIITDVRDGDMVGDISLHPTLLAGHIKANRAAVTASEYPRLLAWVQDNGMLTTDSTDESKYLYDSVENTLVLPNLVGRVIQGDNAVGTKEAGLPAITHTHTGTTNSSGTHSHTFPTVSPDANYQSNSGFVGQSGRGYSYTIPSAGAHTHSVSINNNSAVNDIYGRSDTVQPPSVCLIPQIKY